jgi:hypothetical protein
MAAEKMVRVRGGAKGVRHITMSAWRLERDQARGKKLKPLQTRRGKKMDDKRKQRRKLK